MGATAQRLQDTKRRGTSRDTIIDVSFDFSPLNDLVKKLSSMENIDFPYQMEWQILPSVFQFLTEQIKSAAPVSDLPTAGMLKKAIDWKVVRYESGVVFAILGVDSGVFEEVQRISQRDREESYYWKWNKRKKEYVQGRLRGEARRRGEAYMAKVRPSKYFHLVEFGHDLKGDKGHFAGHNFFTSTINANRDKIIDMVRTKLLELIET